MVQKIKMGIYKAICQRFAKPIRGKNERYGIPILQIWGLEVFTVKGGIRILPNLGWIIGFPSTENDVIDGIIFGAGPKHPANNTDASKASSVLSK